MDPRLPEVEIISMFFVAGVFEKTIHLYKNISKEQTIMAQKKFKTEVSQLLDLIVHSLYSHKEIFLRELVSNASDALDKLKYLTFTNEDYKKVEFDPRIDITFTDEKKRTLTLKDSGIGMNENELNEQLGTIARSGTKKFLNQMHDDAKKDANLIGQFGVGFYSCFMVSERVEVITRKAGDEKAWKWSSNGRNAYSVDEAERDTHGTTIILHLNDEGEEYANRWQVEQLVKKYSDHIAFPIFLEYDDKTWEGEGARDTATLASVRVQYLLDNYLQPALDPTILAEIDAYVAEQKASMPDAFM